ncbi:AIG2-like protein [Hypomontagnella monticulosa]|nr:AIG2-like protein [Hypomontagnella monticulosa]
MSEAVSKPIFIYGVFRSLRVLAWVLTGDETETFTVSRLIQPAKIHGYENYAGADPDRPLVARRSPSSSVDGYLFKPETESQREKLDEFLRRFSMPVTVLATPIDDDGRSKDAVDADVYLSSGIITPEMRPWSLEIFESERVEDWLRWEKIKSDQGM